MATFLNTIEYNQDFKPLTRIYFFSFFVFQISLFKAAEKTRESVNLEKEAIPSKVLSFYDNSQKLLVDKTQVSTKYK